MSAFYSTRWNDAPGGKILDRWRTCTRGRDRFFVHSGEALNEPGDRNLAALGGFGSSH
jgi:hypothetical protein